MTRRPWGALLGFVFFAAAVGAKVPPGSVEYRRGVARFKAKDYPSAVKSFRAAAKLGHAGGHYQVGKALLKGYGAKKNPKKGRAWIRKAAKLGHRKARKLVAMWAARRAAKEPTDAMKPKPVGAASGGKSKPAVGLSVRDVAMGGEMKKGPPVPAASPPPDSNDPTALRPPTKEERAAAPGGRKSLEAQNAFMDEKRLAELRLQVENEIAWSTFHLAFLHEVGVGVTKDLAKAKELYELAARRGYPLANAFLERLPAP